MADSEGEYPFLECPPLLSGKRYLVWKGSMSAYLNDCMMWKVVKDGPHVPRKTIGTQYVPKEESEWDAYDRKLIQLNDQAKQKLYRALVNGGLAEDELTKIFDFESAKEIWDRLEEIGEDRLEKIGEDIQVKQSKIMTLERAYECFRKKPEESIREMFMRLTDISNALRSLGETYTDARNARKILRSLPKNWKGVAVRIQETNDLTKLSLSELFYSLKVHEARMKANEEETKQKKQKRKLVQQKKKLVLARMISEMRELVYSNDF